MYIQSIEKMLLMAVSDRSVNGSGRNPALVLNSAGVKPPVRFGVFEFLPESLELRKCGIKLKLGAQPARLLSFLLEHPGEVVTREILQKELWASDTFVEFEAGLNTAVKKVRQVLGDTAEHPHYIETLPRQGYRFIAPVEPTPVPQ